MKKEEANDVVQFLIPKIEETGISKAYCKVDVTTERTGRKQGDVWISKHPQTETKKFENNIVALIEAKHRNCIIGDIDWRDAMRQGKEKALKQNLAYYIVTNCISDFRFYNAFSDEEISLDGTIITGFQPLIVLEKIQSQVREDNSHVFHRASKTTISFSEAKFRATLKRLEDIYRSAGLKKGDERIDPTVGFVVLKYIGEKESERRTLAKTIKLWDDLGSKALVEDSDLAGDFNRIVQQIWNEDEYKENDYKDFKNLVEFPKALRNQHYKKIYKELNGFHFRGCDFDLFGSIYETFASQEKKKEFGEFYTKRHITGLTARLLLRNEVTGKPLKICDPACGTGGFLTEAYKALERNYQTNGKLNKEVESKLSNETFWGLDNEKKSVARTKLNMFLAGDGHTHIYTIQDSLRGWNGSLHWKENEFDYIMTNPPMGKYEGDAKIEDFEFTNEKRYELLFVEKIIRATKHGGEIAVVINDGALEAPTREPFRLRLLQNCDIYSIISLTKFAFAPYTKEKTYILFLRKKQKEDIGTFQKFPIWHYIVDYDGFANSDKRYKTKYHDDIPELEQMFHAAVNLSMFSPEDMLSFQKERTQFEREVNEREKEEGLSGMKCAYVEIEKVKEGNFHNLLSEFHLRPIEYPKVQEKFFDKELLKTLREAKDLYRAIELLENEVHS